MLGNLSDKFESALKNLSGKGKISEANVRESMAEVREALLEADVNYDVAEAFCERVLEDAVGEKVLGAVEPGEQMIKIVNDELVRLLGGDEALAEGDADPFTGGGAGGGDGGGDGPLMLVSPGPTVIMMAGLQGSGKTTTCGKLANWYARRGKRVMLCAADLQRPAAVTQLQVLVDQVNGLPGEGNRPRGEVLFHGEPEKCAEYGKAVGVAVDVCKTALKKARAENVDILILDTAGRLHINDDLMGELKRVNGAIQPHHIMLVLDAMTGQDAVNSAKAFNDELELDGVVLTKFDSDTRGGAALSVRQVTGKPIRFIGVGETLEALEGFYPTRMAGRILGMGDVVSLVEKAQAEVSEEDAQKLSEKLASGTMTMDDFMKQLRMIRRMGSLKSLMGMLPGVGKQLQGLDIDEKQMDRTEAMIGSMTPAERRDINILNNSRRRRIARGSGSEQADVSNLVKGFDMISKFGKMSSDQSMVSRMQAMTSGRPGAMAGMGGLNAKGSTKAQQNKGYKKRKKR